MTTSKTIGRDTSNDIVIAGNDISTKHATVTRLENNEFEVVDLDSLNGTFVNGYRVLRATISVNDELRISQNPGKIIDLTEIFKLKDVSPKVVKTDESDFSQEFSKLKSLYDNYQKTRIQITKNHQLKTSIIRSVFTLAPLVIFKILQFTIAKSWTEEAKTDFSSNFIVFSVLGSTLAVAATGNMSPIEKISQLDEDFKVKYVCPNPKCRRPLGMVPWTNYYNQGTCSFCKVKYSK
jgi:hypothetical protein